MCFVDHSGLLVLIRFSLCIGEFSLGIDEFTLGIGEFDHPKKFFQAKCMKNGMTNCMNVKKDNEPILKASSTEIMRLFIIKLCLIVGKMKIKQSKLIL